MKRFLYLLAEQSVYSKDDMLFEYNPGLEQLFEKVKEDGFVVPMSEIVAGFRMMLLGMGVIHSLKISNGKRRIIKAKFKIVNDALTREQLLLRFVYSIMDNRTLSRGIKIKKFK